MRSYRNFLWSLGSDLLEAIRVAENEDWHHLPLDDERFKCYNRLATWLIEIDERARHYVTIKGPVTARRTQLQLPEWTTESPRVARQIRGADSGSWESNTGEPDGADDRLGEEGSHDNPSNHAIDV